MFAKNPRKVLTTDFAPDKDEEIKKILRSQNVSFYVTFATAEGQEVLKTLRRVSRKLIDTNQHQTMINVGRRDLVDMIDSAIAAGEKELSK